MCHVYLEDASLLDEHAVPPLHEHNVAHQLLLVLLLLLLAPLADLPVLGHHQPTTHLHKGASKLGVLV